MYVAITANTGRDKEPKKINKIKKLFSGWKNDLRGNIFFCIIWTSMAG